jgi:hypothetical protein
MKIKQFIKKYYLQLSCIGISIFNICAICSVSLYQYKITNEYKQTQEENNKKLLNLEENKKELEKSNKELNIKKQVIQDNLSDYLEENIKQDFYFCEYGFSCGRTITQSNNCETFIYGDTNYTPQAFYNAMGGDYYYTCKNYYISNYAVFDSWNYNDEDISEDTTLYYSGIIEPLYVAYVGQLPKDTLYNFRFTTYTTKLNYSENLWDEVDDLEYEQNITTFSGSNPHYYGYFLTTRQYESFYDMMDDFKISKDALYSFSFNYSYAWRSWNNTLYDYTTKNVYAYIYMFTPYQTYEYFKQDTENNDVVSYIDFYALPNSATYTQDKQNEINTTINDIEQTLKEYEKTIDKNNLQINALQEQIESLEKQIHYQDISFYTLIDGVVTSPITFLSQLFNVNILGVNIWILITGIISGVLILYVIKKVL